MQFLQDDTDNNLNRRQVFRQEVRDQLCEAIFSGTLKAGDKIIETYWAKKLGVSQGPVREAICYLEVLGLVETVPFKGSRVRTMTDKDIRDNYEVQICHEVKALNDVIDTLSDDEMEMLLAHLRKILDRMEEQVEAGDKRAYISYDKEFHEAIILAADNGVLHRLWDQCNMRTWFIFSMNTSSARLKALQADHIRIYEALERRDKEDAQKSLRHHLTDSMKRFTKRAHGVDDEDDETEVPVKKAEPASDSWHYGSAHI
ncbi:MAG: GntR family transcriptional regulator [Lachnospiraceae bacterium]|nr:GntR family transcriptional regulator [Candidatus Equihabitans merdae]